MIGRPWMRALSALGAVSLAACAVNPATGERQLSFIGEEREIEIGREADAQIVATLGVYPDDEVGAYVDRLGQELAARSERPRLPWTFRVVDDPTVNAFALPGGFIYITRGILSHLTSEAQLVGVLGHEIGHVTARHSVNQMSRQQLTQLGLGIGMILSEDVRRVSDLAGAGLQLLSLSYGRGDETEADELGIRYMRRTGHDPRELADVMRMLERTAQVHGGGGRVPEWLSTHPHPENRVEHIHERLNATGEDFSNATVAREPFLERLEGLVFGPNPREGFFEGDVFHHPDLRFRVRIPSGWRGVNQKTAVQAISPGEDAVMALTLAEGTARDALARFGGQEGLRIGSVRTDPVDGSPGAQAEFEARTEQGTVRGTVLFLEHGGNTYRLLGYAGSSAWASYRAEVVSAMRSFRTETDPDVLAVEPDRLELVRVGDTLTLAQFMSRHPSDASPDVVALINQVDPAGTIAAGTLAKRVRPGN